MIRSAMRRVLIALLALLFAATGCGGGGDGGPAGKRLKISDLGFEYLVREEHRFHGTCPPPGRITVDFQPGDEITIRSENRLLASLSAQDAFIGCRDTRIGPSPRGGGWTFARFTTDLKQSTQLICVTDEPIVIDVDPLYEFSQQLVGGTIYISTPTRTPYPRALIPSGFDESGDSTRLNYHIPRCRVSGRG